MWYILIAGFLALGIFFSSRLINQNSRNEENEINSKISVNSTGNINDTIKAMFSRKQIDKKLKHLAESPIPNNLSEGAMCYEMAYKENKVHEYICPVCGEKTIYKKSKDELKFRYVDNILDSELYDCRTELSKVKGINIKLDETEFCSHCSPKTEEPKLYLLINIAGQIDTTKLSNFNHMDIRMIYEFLNDDLIHEGGQGFQLPLKENIERIKELLGLK